MTYVCIHLGMVNSRIGERKVNDIPVVVNILGILHKALKQRERKFAEEVNVVMFLFLAHHNSGTSRHSRKYKRFMYVSLKTYVRFLCECSQVTDVNGSVKLPEI